MLMNDHSFSVAASGRSNQAFVAEALLIDVEKRNVDLSIQLFEMNRTEAGLRAALDNALNQPSPACVNNFQLDLRDGKENSVTPKKPQRRSKYSTPVISEVFARTTIIS